LTEGFPATAADRFHKELRFFFSLLKRKKEAKKEKKRVRISPVLYGKCITRNGKCITRSAALLYFNVTNELDNSAKILYNKKKSTFQS